MNDVKYYQGKYKVRNPNKYNGDKNNVVYRSSWELKCFRWLDSNNNVVEWGSEEIIIPYFSEIENRWRRYFVDIIAKINVGKEIKTYLIEVKPKIKTVAPKIKNKITKGYIMEVYDWGVNQSKWKAATQYCKNRGWEFKILTEQEIFGKE